MFQLKNIFLLTLTEQEVLEQADQSTIGGIFIWFLCAIAFLKVASKIEVYLSTLGINTGNAGSPMM